MLNASLLLCAAVQAKFPADGLIKTAASGAIQGKTVLMKAEDVYKRQALGGSRRQPGRS